MNNYHFIVCGAWTKKHSIVLKQPRLVIPALAEKDKRRISVVARAHNVQ
jgi:hypothetical protein